MHLDNKRLIQLLDTFLTRHGFRKKSNTWYAYEGDIIKVIYLQKSSYSNLYYVNLSIYFQAIQYATMPKESECHLRTRLDNELVGYDKEYDYLFDLGKQHVDNDSYKEALNSCVENVILPQLDLIKTKEGFQQIIERNPVMLNIVPLKLKAYWNI